MSAVMVERVLEYHGDAGVEPAFARVLTPFDEGRNWRCQYQLSWPGYEREFGACGEDAWQALQLAMYSVPSAIFATDDFKAGRIGMWGGRLSTYEEICELFGVKPVDGPKP
jgi:hypothetical protein